MDGDNAALRAAVEDRIRFETLIADLASQFVSLDPALIDDAITDAQRQLVEALGVDRSTLFQLADSGDDFVFTHFWSRPGLPAPPQAMTGREFPLALATIRAGQLFCLSSLDELPPEAPDREALRRIGSKATVALPLVAGGRVIGALSFGSMHTERTWPPEIVNRLRLVAQVFASALARKLADTALRKALDENARLRDQLIEENVYLRQEVKVRQGTSEAMGESPAIRRVQEQIEQVAPTNATVLLLGETGTGKELAARAIHDRSPRAGRTMVRVNCAAIPTALIESELFGREKGAYTGALARQAGRFEVADGSTIFLDEIGDLPAEVQIKLLRVLQEKEIERLGSSRTTKVDLRVVAATNRDLEQAVADGAFREDLYYRLNVFPIRIPPLRERLADLPTLVWAFVDEVARGMGKRIESIPKENLASLERYPWPGNVRELRNVIERAVIIATGPRLAIAPPRDSPASRRRPMRLTDVEREHIRSVLEQTGWRVRGAGGAAEVLGLKPSTLEGRMTKLELRRPSRIQM